MKRFVIYMFLQFCVIIVLMATSDFINKKLLLASSASPMFKMDRLYGNVPHDEIAILGSSRAEGCFAPLSISSKAFNYGLVASRFNETVFHLEEVLRREGNAPVIINLEPWGLTTGAFRGDYRSVSDVPAVKMESGIAMSYDNMIPGIRFYGELRRNLSWTISGSKVIERGAVMLKSSRSEDEWGKIRDSSEMVAYDVDEDVKSRLSKILSSNHVHEIVFVVAPVMPFWWEKFGSKLAFSDLKEWLKTFPRVCVMDYSCDNEFGAEDFFDPIHLNEKGARRFSEKIRCQLEDKKIISSGE